MGRRGGEAIRNGELAQHPAIGQMVIQDVGVTVVLGLAGPAEAAPQRVDVERPGQRDSLLVEDLKRNVDHLDEMVRAHGSDSVSGSHAADI